MTSEEKPLPKLPENDAQDLPIHTVGAKEKIRGGQETSKRSRKSEKDPEGEHRRSQERSKLKFAMWFATGTVTAAVALSVAGSFIPVDSGGSLEPAFDLLRFLAPTALGYIFGRTVGKD